MKITFDNSTIELIPSDKSSYRATMGDKTIDVEILGTQDEKLDLLINGERVTAYVSSENAKRWVTINGRTYLLTKQTGSRKSGGGHHHIAGELTAPMPGQIRAINVSEGDEVTKGQTLIVLEAMKMEMKIQAPSNGTVSKLFVKQGETVEREQMLIEVS
ncbi:MAG TPA: biotin/lipoyl-containing protein [Anaerolineales bacterium]|nr:biotin/lipoyl-containing protein [Anaerolineales bacterium]